MRVPVKHNLPKEEVRRRLRERMPELPAHMPGGTADVTTEWPSEDCMKMTVGAMGQTADAFLLQAADRGSGVGQGDQAALGSSQKYLS